MSNLTVDIHAEMLVENYKVISLYVPVVILALVANILVILVVVKYNCMRSVTNYFLVNLAVADLFVTLICMPNAMWQAYSTLWNFGEISCKLTHYFQCVAVASSVFTITVMALDRYMVITRPFGYFSRCFNKKTTLVVIAGIWTFSLTLSAPILIVKETHTEVFPLIDNITDEVVNVSIVICRENWNVTNIPQQAFGIMMFSFMFALPGCLILYAYSMMGKKLCSVAPPFDSNEGVSSSRQSARLVKERRRVAWILLLLAFLFAICWLPYNLMMLLLDTNSSITVPELTQYVLFLGHFNSALNPIIYCAMSKNFRRSVRHLLSGMWPRIGTSRRQLQWVDSSKASQRHYLERLKPVPVMQNPCKFNISPMQSSQKTTKTCTV